MIFFSFIAVIIVLINVTEEKNVHEFYIEKNACKISEEREFKGFFKELKLSCDWNKFVETNEEYLLLDEEMGRDRIYYEIEVLKSKVKSDHPKYQTLNKSLFKNFRIKSLKMRNLELKTIEKDSLSEECCGNYLKSLDLSSNNLNKIEAEVLSNLKRLEILNVSYNQLSLSEYNFKNNKNLNNIDLSNNNLNYLPSNLFYNLNQVDSIDLSNNDLKEIDACVLANIQTSQIAKNLYPAYINLENNRINCDCDIFFLSRHAKYDLNLTCDKPDFYSKKKFSSLKLEDPEKRCDYSKMARKCNASSGILELILIITLAILTLLFLLLTIVCCCKNMALNKKVKNLKSQILKPQKQTTKPIYVNSGIVNSDKEKLIS